MQPTEVNSLAAFKRFLKEPGAAIEMIQHDWYPQPVPGIRKVKKLQTNGVQFEPTEPGKQGSWLYFDRAKDFRFENGIMKVALDPDKTGFDKVMIYKLHKLE